MRPTTSTPSIPSARILQNTCLVRAQAAGRLAIADGIREIEENFGVSSYKQGARRNSIGNDLGFFVTRIRTSLSKPGNTGKTKVEDSLPTRLEVSKHPLSSS